MQSAQGPVGSNADHGQCEVTKRSACFSLRLKQSKDVQATKNMLKAVANCRKRLVASRSMPVACATNHAKQPRKPQIWPAHYSPTAPVWARQLVEPPPLRGPCPGVPAHQWCRDHHLQLIRHQGTQLSLEATDKARGVHAPTCQHHLQDNAACHPQPVNKYPPSWCGKAL